MDEIEYTLDNNKFDLIISEYKLGNKTILDLLHILKSKNINVPVIMIAVETEEITNRIIPKILEAGAKSFIAKPVT